MQNLPKISIVTPSFNQGRYIEQTILSIINQGYPNLEYIIIDGGSSDETIDIIKKYEAHISYWVSKPDKGQSDAINKGLDKCTGEIFNWINSDDYLEPGALVAIAHAFNENTDIVCGYSRIFNDVNNATIQMHRTELYKTAEQSFVEQKLNQQGMWYKLNIFKYLGGINAELHYVMDLELFWKYLLQFGQVRIKLINDVIAHFRIHNESKTGAYEERFRQEEAAILFSLLSQSGYNKSWTNYFCSPVNYLGQKWNLGILHTTQFRTQLAQKYLYPAYKKGDLSFARKAFVHLIKQGKVKFSLQNFAMFTKLFIGDVPFRKFLNERA